MRYGLLMAAFASLLHAAGPIAQLALSAPPEFAADALLRLVESKRVNGRKEAADLVQQAFDLAAQAQFRAMRRPVSVGADTQEGTLAKAYALKLDAVSLQARAITAMAAIDGARAREMFTSAVRPEVPAHSCENLLTYDFLDYYQALTVVLKKGFSATERAKEDHVSLLLDAVSQVQWPAQIAPLEQTIGGGELTTAQRDLLMVRLNGRRAAVAASSTCEKPDEPHEYWRSAAALRIMDDVRNLRTNLKTRFEQLPDIQKNIEMWGPASENSGADYYQQKCIVYEALVELIPAGPQRDNLLESFIAFVKQSDLQRENPVEWFVPVHSMLERVRNANDGEPEKVLEAFEGSGNPVLVLRAALESL